MLYNGLHLRGDAIQMDRSHSTGGDAMEKFMAVTFFVPGMPKGMAVTVALMPWAASISSKAPRTLSSRVPSLGTLPW